MAGFDVQVKAAGRLVLTQVDGKAMPVPLEKRAEAFAYKHAGWLGSMPAQTAARVTALAGQLAKAGIEELENPQIFNTPAVT